MPKRIGNIDGVKLYDIVKSRENCILALKKLCKGHSKDPMATKIKENFD